MHPGDESGKGLPEAPAHKLRPNVLLYVRSARKKGLADWVEDMHTMTLSGFQVLDTKLSQDMNDIFKHIKKA